MTTETLTVDAANPRSSAASASARRYEGRDHVGDQDLRQRRRPTRPSPRCCSRAASTRASTSRSRCACTCSTSSRTATRPTRGSRTSSTSREIWIIFNLNPDGAEYDIATGSYRSWRKNRQPNSRLERDRHRPQPQLELPVGLLRRLERHVLVGDLPRRRRRSRRPRPSACATSSTAASSAACSRSRRAIDFHTYSELVLWPYGYTTANTTPTLTADDEATFSHDRRATWRAPTATRPSRPATSTSPTARSTTGLWGAAQDLRLHVRDVPAQSNPGFYPPDEVIAGADVAQPRAPCCSCWKPPTARTG